MAPAEAAALLGIGVDAAPDLVDRAYRLQAQLWHPDRFTTATPAELAAAAGRFDRVSQAREVLRRAAADRGPSPAPAAEPSNSTAPADPPVDPWAGRPWAADTVDEPGVPAGPWLTAVWTGLYCAAATIGFLVGPLPYSLLDLWLRLVPLGLVSVAFALTGHRGFLAGIVGWGAVTAALTVAFASFGPLLALLLTIPPVLGLTAIGRQRMLRRRLLPRRDPAPVEPT